MFEKGIIPEPCPVWFFSNSGIRAFFFLLSKLVFFVLWFCNFQIGKLFVLNAMMEIYGNCECVSVCVSECGCSVFGCPSSLVWWRPAWVGRARTTFGLLICIIHNFFPLFFSFSIY